MSTLTNRLYAGPDDLQAMLQLLFAVRPAARLADYPGPVDLRELLALPAVQVNTRLWLDSNGRLVAFAFVDQYDNLRFEMDPQTSYPDLGREIVGWGVACLRRAMSAGDETRTLDASCREDDAGQIALLERHGFVRQELRSLRLVRRLTEPIPPPQLPPGFAIRHVQGEQEVAALVALHRAAFGTEYMTAAERLAMMRGLEYEAELDLVVVAADGRLAAYCLCAISQEENERTGRQEGHTDPAATHPDFQRRGLARALLLTGLRLLQERGMDTAVLGTSSDNPAMLGTAQSVGFQVQTATCWFSRPVSGVPVTAMR
ncbi:MAG: GNAT family N-acetyltransferase [Chloroflexi bacterium]|nr:GNAT family N-acetyltransferase [Chloroflexota bacterium]